MKSLISTFILCILICLTAMNSFSQSTQVNTDFKNQGEQELYWVKQFFRKEYKESQYNRYSSRILHENDIFIFSKDSLRVNSEDVEIATIFLKGLLYPEIIGGNRISNIEEIKFPELTSQIRRFTFLLYRVGLLNPTICFFELTNLKADKITTLSKFITNAKLTFFKQGWLLI